VSQHYYLVLPIEIVLFFKSIISSGSDLLIDPNSPDKALSIDLKSLRAARVIRPLKLVNGVPSKFFHVYI
jgi:hypothetical protein